MEIVYNDNINKVPFDILKEGDVFKYNTILFMKIQSFYASGTTCNAVRLDNGKYTDFIDDEYVEPVKGKFVMD